MHLSCICPSLESLRRPTKGGILVNIYSLTRFFRDCLFVDRPSIPGLPGHLLDCLQCFPHCMLTFQAFGYLTLGLEAALSFY